jgi:uncharacterized protein (TIGR02145 family)
MRLYKIIIEIILIFLLILTGNANSLLAQTGTVTDIDGNVYHTVTIGTQTWMVENLKTTKYRNGEAIPNVTDTVAWINLKTKGAWCNYDNNPSNAATYGRLYNWYAINDRRNIAPTGWHVPTDAEWTTLTTYLGGLTVAGGKLKEAGTTHWASPNTGATNESGFTALPGGIGGSYFDGFSAIGTWWSSTEEYYYSAYTRYMYYNYKYVRSSSYFKHQGLSVRCVRDGTQIPILTTSLVSNITQTTATSGGNITSDGGSTIKARGVCWSTENTPSIVDCTTIDGTGTGSFTSNIAGLVANTTYYVRAYATNSAGTGYGNAVTFTTQAGTGGTVTDIDGNVYHTVTIGTQTWMVENLKTTKYRNSDVIPNVTGNPNWFNQTILETGGYCNYADNSNYAATYGRLYNWYAVSDTRNIAPTGWHVPSDAEWTTLTNYLGGEDVAGGKLKEAGTAHWKSPNFATNESGFTALPGGFHLSEEFYSIGDVGAWWSSTEDTIGGAWIRYAANSIDNLYRWGDRKFYGYSIRCIKDLTNKVEIPVLNTNTVTNKTINSATLGANITSDGGATITERGVVWSTTSNPTITSNLGKKSTTGTTGQFSVNVTGLTPNTIYHFRGYATNSVGTGYSADTTFTTIGNLPTATTNTATNVASSGATLNGTINANSFSTTVTFEYGLTTSYGTSVIATPNTVTGTSNTNVTAILTNLQSNTTYHYRVKAVSSAGTSVGNDMTFTTTIEQGIKIKIIGGENLNISKLVFIDKDVFINDRVIRDIYNDTVTVPISSLSSLEEINTIELRNTSNTLVGHMPLNMSGSTVKSQTYLEMILFIHNINNNKDNYPGWSYYSNASERPITMLIPPLKKLSKVDQTHIPVLFVHGVSGCFGDSWNKDGQVVYSINPNGNSNNYDCWQFYYPYDDEIEKIGTMLGDAIDKILNGTAIGSSAYNTNKIDIVAHSMGGLVARSYIQGLSGNHNDNIDKFLMLGTPNHGSYMAHRFYYDKYSPVISIIKPYYTSFENKDEYSPAYKQMSPASEFLFNLNTIAFPLKSEGSNKRCLVIAGYKDWIPIIHTEIYNQDDGIVSLTSASLKEYDIGLKVLNFTHDDLHNNNMMVDYIKNFLDGNLSSDESGEFDRNTTIMNLKIPGANVSMFALTTEQTWTGNIINLEPTIVSITIVPNSSRITMRQVEGSNYYSSTYNLSNLLESAGLGVFTEYGLRIGESNLSSNNILVFRKNYFLGGTKSLQSFSGLNLSLLRSEVRNIILIPKVIDEINGQSFLLTNTSGGYFSKDDKVNNSAISQTEFIVDSKTNPLIINLFALPNSDFIKHGFNLITPSGLVIDTNYAKNNSKVSYEQNLSEGWVCYYIKDPIRGTWKANYNVNLKNIVIAGVLSMEVQIKLTSLDTIININQPIRFEAELSSTEAYTNEKLSASLLYAATKNDKYEEISKITLSKTNLNKYSGSFIPTKSGIYIIKILSDCYISGELIQREASQSFVIAQTQNNPVTPYLIQPSTNSTNISSLPVFVWSKNSNEETYRFQLTTSPTFAFIELDTLGLKTISFVPKSLDNKTTYYWRVSSANSFGVSSWSDIWSFSTSGTINDVEEVKHFITFKLTQNYPNPFNPTTRIEYSIPENSFVELKIFDTFGREVETLVNKQQTIGTYSLQWEPKNLTSGVYFYRIRAGKYNETRKMVYIR